jgi:hypothetical protein
MRRLALIMFGASLFVSASLALAEGSNVGAIDQKQEDAFVKFLSDGGKNADLLHGLPGLDQGVLDPIPVVTGRPCILPGPNESLHFIPYVKVQGKNRRRMVFEFTLRPALPFGSKVSSLSDLVKNRSVTQYWVWMASEDPQAKGIVITFKSRSKRGMCE